MTSINIIVAIVIIILIYLNYKKNILLRQEKNIIVEWHISRLWSDIHYQIVASTEINYTISDNILYKTKSILANLPSSWKREIWESVVNKLKEDKRSYDADSQHSVLLFEKVISEYQKYLKI